MDSAFLRGCKSDVLARPIVFGLKLKPLTLGHVFLLESLDSPLFRPNSEIGFADVSLAVFVCSDKAENSRRAMSKWWLPLFLWLWAKFSRPYWMLHDIDAFRAYLKDGMSSPIIRPVARDGGRVANAPGLYVKLLFAMHVLGLSRSEAMDCEIVELNALYATWAEWNGSGEIVNSDDMNALWEAARKHDEATFNPDGTRKVNSGAV